MFKKVFDWSKAGGDHVYGAVISPDARAMAWLQTRGVRENLVFSPNNEERDIKTYCITHNTRVLSPCFLGRFLIWVECMENACTKDAWGRYPWWIRIADTALNRPGEFILEPFEHQGRPCSLQAWTLQDASGRGGLVWEERNGRNTIIKLSIFNGSTFSRPSAVTDGRYNAYDPVAVVDIEGIWHVAYTAFTHGNYRILLQNCGKEGFPIKPPLALSHRCEPCIWPSLWPRHNGGVLFSYTRLKADSEMLTEARGVVNHMRRQMQHGVQRSEGRLMAGLALDEKLYALMLPEDTGRYTLNAATMTVPGIERCGNSRIIEDHAGQVHILFRQHRADDSEISADEEKTASFPGVRKSSVRYNNMNYYPYLCLIRLEKGKWTSVKSLVGTAHHLGIPTAALKKDGNLVYAFTEDTRRRIRDYVDIEYSTVVGLGVIKTGIETSKDTPVITVNGNDYGLHLFVPAIVPGPSMEEPEIPENQPWKWMRCIQGQLHIHTIHSVCSRYCERDIPFQYRFMQDVMHAEFGAITDHCWNLGVTERLVMNKMAEYYYFPGEFVALPSYEWTGHETVREGRVGHVNPAFFEEEGNLEVYTPIDDDRGGGGLEGLRKVFKGSAVIAPPHHTVSRNLPYSWEHYYPDFQPVAEIFQDVRGNCEQLESPGISNWGRASEPYANWILTALKFGARLGFIGGGDHFGVAMAGIQTRELTRSALYKALIERHCYATTGTRVRMEFSCNGSPMGSIVESDTEINAGFHFRAEGAEIIRELQVVRCGETVAVISSGNYCIEHEWGSRILQTSEFWYCRIVFENGEIAWSSPIWVGVHK